MLAEPTADLATPALVAPSAVDADIAISVRGVGKMYRIYDRPQDRLKQMLWRGRRMYGREFWALRDVSFDLPRGETLGIVGRNGSGKSTLLQIIAGTLTPTEGDAHIGGRVAALLELGSGFNPEFTGRENVFMNGAILGLSRQEMEELFDEIAAFADIGEFIDQPVKLYSSGMAVRLAFAVQAFVPKEILIVDEALAVGDMFFQAKCMAQMKRMLDSGVTVVFVSHDTGSIKSLCRRALLLDHGRLVDDDAAAKVVEHYFSLKVKGEQSVIDASKLPAPVTQTDRVTGRVVAVAADDEFQKRAAFQRIQNGKAQFADIQLLDQSGRPISEVEYNQIVTLRLVIQVHKDMDSELTFGYHIRAPNGVDAVYSDSVIEDKSIEAPRSGDWYVVDWTFQAALKAGHYNIAAVLSIPILLSASQVDFCDFVPLAVQFYMSPRPDAYLYGLVHWDNHVVVQKYQPD
jgi:lipopolysaccharide transport system ATP-binding protein